MKKLVSAVLAAFLLAAVPACSAGDDAGGSNSVSGETGGKTAAKMPKKNKLAELSPAEARQQLMERGYTLDQNGFREAVDFLDPDAAALFVALGFDVNAMADALSYPVNRAGAYEESKLPGHLEANLSDPAYRAILATMFQHGFSPTEPVRGEASTTSLFAESLRIGDDDFISFLRGFDADWVTKPGCYQHNPRCRNEGTLDGWLFYIPDREPSWDVDTALAAYARLTDLGMAQPVAGEDSDPYLMASLAFQKFLWVPDNAEVDALWQQVGSPRIILPYGTSVEDEARSADPDKAMFASGARSGQRKYLLDKVFNCIADNGDDYWACLESPPAE